VAGGGHRVEDRLQVLPRVAEVPLAPEEGGSVGGSRGQGAEEPVDHDFVLVYPAAVGPAAGKQGLDLHVAQDSVFVQVHQDHPAWPERTPLAHLGRGKVEDSGLRSEDHEAVFGDGVARRP
jgi:hypothetical protein